MTTLLRWTLLFCAIVLAYYAAHGQPPPAYCSLRANPYHCGLPDERVPFVVPVVRMENPVPAFVYAGIDQMTRLRPGFVSAPRTRDVRSGGDPELEALGKRVTVGTMFMGMHCLVGQKYVFTIGLRDNFTDITYTCAAPLRLSSPAFRSYKNGKMVPYTGGPTWTNVR